MENTEADRTDTKLTLIELGIIEADRTETKLNLVELGIQEADRSETELNHMKVRYKRLKELRQSLISWSQVYTES